MNNFPYEPAIQCIQGAVNTINNVVRDSMSVLAGRYAEVRSASVVELSNRIENEQLEPFPLPTDAVVELQVYAFCAKRFAVIQQAIEEIQQPLRTYTAQEEKADVVVPRQERRTGQAAQRTNGAARTNGASDVQAHTTPARPRKARLTHSESLRRTFEWAQRYFNRKELLPFKIEGVANSIGVSKNTVSDNMRKLILAKVIIKDGERALTKYRLGNKHLVTRWQRLVRLP